VGQVPHLNYNLKILFMKKYFIIFTVVETIQQRIVNVSGVYDIDLDCLVKDQINGVDQDFHFDRFDKSIVSRCGLDPNKSSIASIVPL